MHCCYLLFTICYLLCAMRCSAELSALCALCVCVCVCVGERYTLFEWIVRAAQLAKESTLAKWARALRRNRAIGQSHAAVRLARSRFSSHGKLGGAEPSRRRVSAT